MNTVFIFAKFIIVIQELNPSTPFLKTDRWQNYRPRYVAVVGILPVTWGLWPNLGDVSITDFWWCEFFGIFSIYMEYDRPWVMESISTVVQASWFYDVAAFLIFRIFGFGIWNYFKLRLKHSQTRVNALFKYENTFRFRFKWRTWNKSARTVWKSRRERAFPRSVWCFS